MSDNGLRFSGTVKIYALVNNGNTDKCWYLMSDNGLRFSGTMKMHASVNNGHIMLVFDV